MANKKEDGGGNRPNDQRSNVKNPNNPAFPPARDNRADQLNPNNPQTKPKK